jgi:hypothetical protein
MTENIETTSGVGWRTWLSDRVAELRQREGQVFLVLALVIGALTGLAVVAFILLTERMGMRLYPVGGAPWRRLLFPVVGSLGIGYLLYRYFPDARGSGVFMCQWNFRHCFAAILVSVAAEVVYALNPRISALFHYCFELPGNWLLALEFRKRAVLRNFFVDIVHEDANFPRDRRADLFPYTYVVNWANGQRSPSRAL